MYRDHGAVVFSPLCHFENRSRFPLTMQPIKLIRSSLGRCFSHPTLFKARIQHLHCSSSVSLHVSQSCCAGLDPSSRCSRLFNDVVQAVTSGQNVIPQRPASHASPLHVVTEDCTAVNPVLPAPNPPCATVGTTDDSAHIRSVFESRPEHDKWLFVVDSERPCWFDPLRLIADYEREVSSQEWACDHKTSADYGKVGFGNAEGDTRRDHDSAG